MKINNRVFKTLTGEPFKTQEIDGHLVEFYSMNDTPFLQQYVTRGRFYIWTSNGKSYKLLIEKGYYEKVSYFFEQEINEIWINFLVDASQTQSKVSRTFLTISLGLSLLIIILFSFLWMDKISFGIIAALIVTIIVNMIQQKKVNALIGEKNTKAVMQIKEVLGEKGFNDFLNDQDEYAKDYFNFDEEELEEDVSLVEDIVEEVEELELTELEDEIIEEEVELVKEAILEAEILEDEVLEETVVEEVITETVKKPRAKRVEYSKMTVAELKDLAREREIVGYSTLRKQELIDLLKKNR